MKTPPSTFFPPSHLISAHTVYLHLIEILDSTVHLAPLPLYQVPCSTLCWLKKIPSPSMAGRHWPSVYILYYPGPTVFCTWVSGLWVVCIGFATKLSPSAVATRAVMRNLGFQLHTHTLEQWPGVQCTTFWRWELGNVIILQVRMEDSREKQSPNPFSSVHECCLFCLPHQHEVAGGWE